MMAVLLTVLKVLGIVFLVLLAVLIILMLCVLFVPFRYSFSGAIDDPEGSTRVFHLDPKKDISAAGEVRWLLGAFHFTTAVGGGDDQTALVRMDLRIFGKRVPVDQFLKRAEHEDEEEKKEETGTPGEKKSLEEKIEAVLRRVEKLYLKMEDVLNVLHSQYGERDAARFDVIVDFPMPPFP